MRDERSDYGWTEERPHEREPTRGLLSQFLSEMGQLARSEIELARTELRTAVKKQVAMVVGFAAAGVFLMLGAGVLVAALVLVLAQTMPAWTAALVVGAVTIVIGVALLVAAKSAKVEKPFERTERTLKENVRWLRKRMA